MSLTLDPSMTFLGIYLTFYFQNVCKVICTRMSVTAELVMIKKTKTKNLKMGDDDGIIIHRNY